MGRSAVVLTVLNCGRGPTDHFPREHLCGLARRNNLQPLCPASHPMLAEIPLQVFLSRADQFMGELEKFY